MTLRHKDHHNSIRLHLIIEDLTQKTRQVKKMANKGATFSWQSCLSTHVNVPLPGGDFSKTFCNLRCDTIKAKTRE